MSVKSIREAVGGTLRLVLSSVFLKVCENLDVSQKKAAEEFRFQKTSPTIRGLETLKQLRT